MYGFVFCIKMPVTPLRFIFWNTQRWIPILGEMFPSRQIWHAKGNFTRTFVKSCTFWWILHWKLSLWPPSEKCAGIKFSSLSLLQRFYAKLLSLIYICKSLIFIRTLKKVLYFIHISKEMDMTCFETYNKNMRKPYDCNNCTWEKSIINLSKLLVFVQSYWNPHHTGVKDRS